MPTGSWRSGQDITASGWTNQLPGPLFATDNTLGSLTSRRAGGKWRFEIDPRADRHPVGFLLSNGYRFFFSDADSLTVVVTTPGLLVGRASKELNPRLIAVGSSLLEKNHCTCVEANGEYIAFSRKEHNDGIDFLLAISPTSSDEALRQIQAAAEISAEALFEEEISRRAFFWNSLPSTKVAAATLMRGVEDLIAHLMPPNDSIPFRWSRADRRNAASNMDINQTWLLASAWCSIDPQVAEDLVKAALSCQREDGLIPARSGADATRSDALAWPLMAQSVRQVWSVTKNTAFAEYCLPRLERYLSRALDYYDPRGAGFPRWKNADESLDPASFHPDVAPVELIGLLTSEIEAYEQLAKAVPSAQARQSLLSAEQTLFLNHLTGIFWDSKAFAFKDRIANGTPVERCTSAHMMPWLCEGLPASYKKTSIQLNPRLEKETEPRQVFQAFLILQCCRQAHLSKELGVIQNHLRKELEKAFQDGLPNHFALSALLAVLEKMPADARPSDSSPSKLAIKMESHRHLFVGIFVGLAILMTLGIFASIFARRQPPLQSTEALLALARQHYAQGHYDEALQVYSNMMAEAQGIAAIEFGMANAFFKKGQYQDAERLYRHLLQSQRPMPSALMNLAISLHRQGRTEEAMECYRQFDEQYRDQYSGLSARARLAMDLIREQTKTPLQETP